MSTGPVARRCADEHRAQDAAPPHGSITDVPGIRVGHAERVGDGWLTGVTVVLPPAGTSGAVQVRGAAPGTHETDALGAGAVSPFPTAIALTGGSAYGLAAVTGVVRWCAEQGAGFRVGDGPRDVVPVVPGAAIFDLGRGGDATAVPDAELGYAAAVAAGTWVPGAPVRRGTVGAGTGATLDDERAKGGVGTAATVLTWDDGQIVVGALAVVNAYGTVAPGPHGRLAARGPLIARPPGPRGRHARLNTTLVVVATDARLDHGQLGRTAGAGHTGLARVLDPVHTLADGDTVFALATGQVALPGDDGGRDVLASRDALIGLQETTAHVVAAAVLDAVRSATAVRTPVLDLPRLALP